jgi:hypothetical protein
MFPENAVQMLARTARENGQMVDACGNHAATAHYHVFEGIKKISDLKTIFPEGKADDLNWAFLSTSGIHGSYISLDDLEKDPDCAECVDEEGNCTITVLVLHPRMCCIKFGEMKFNLKEDSAYLRGLVKSTVEEITKFADGNL